MHSYQKERWERGKESLILEKEALILELSRM